MILNNIQLDINKIEILSDIFYNLISFERSFDQNFLPYILLKYNPSDFSFTYKDRDIDFQNENKIKNLIFSLNSNGKFSHFGDFSVIENNKFLIEFDSYLYNPYILDEVLDYHIKTYHNNLYGKIPLDYSTKLKLPLFGDTKILSASSVAAHNNLNILIRLVKLNQKYFLYDIFKPLFLNKEYINLLSNKELDVISYFYNILTGIKIDFNEDKFDNYLSLIEIIDF